MSSYNPYGKSTPQVNVTLDSGSSTVGGLSDVTLTAPNDTEVLTYSSSSNTWINAPGGGGGGGGTTLSSLTDTAIVSVIDKQHLVYDSATLKWKNTAPETTALDDVSDVTLTSVTTSDVLTYNGSAWINSAPPTIPANLPDLGDVTITAPANAQVLTYNGSNWVNLALPAQATVAMSDISDTNLVTVTDKDLLQFNGTNWVNINLLKNITFDTSKMIVGGSDYLEFPTNQVLLSSGTDLKLQTTASLFFDNMEINKNYAKIHGTSWEIRRNDNDDFVRFTNSNIQFLTDNYQFKSAGGTNAMLLNGSTKELKILGNVKYNGSLSTCTFEQNKTNGIWDFKLKNTAVGTKFRVIDGSDGQLLSVNGDGTIEGISISKLDDTTITTPAEGHILTYDNTSSKWINSAPSGGASLANFTFANDLINVGGTASLGLNGTTKQTTLYGNVDFSGANTLQFQQNNNVAGFSFRFNDDNVGSEFLISNGSSQPLFKVNATGGVVCSDLLTDVNVSATASGQLLQHNGTKWVNLDILKNITFNTNKILSGGTEVLTFVGTTSTTVGTGSLIVGDTSIGSNVVQFDKASTFVIQDETTQARFQVGAGSSNVFLRGSVMVTDNGGTERFRVSQTGAISTGAELNPDVDAGGLTLNHGAGTGNVLSLKSSDITHDMTNIEEADTYATLSKLSALGGGVSLKALNDGGAQAFALEGFASASENLQLANSSGCINLVSSIRDGALGSQNMGATDNLLAFKNGTTTVGIIKGSGDLISFGGLESGLASTTAGSLKLYNAGNDNTVSLQSGVTSTGYTMTLPTAVASAGEFLTDVAGDGVLSWATPAGGGGSTGNWSFVLDDAFISGQTYPFITGSQSGASVLQNDVTIRGEDIHFANSAGDIGGYFEASNAALYLKTEPGVQDLTLESRGTNGGRMILSARSDFILNTSEPSTARLQITSAGQYYFWALTASADVQTDASKRLTTVSDERLKKIYGRCEYGLNELMKVKPIRYSYLDDIKDTPDAPSTVGFSAQNCLSAGLVEASPLNEETGYYGFNGRCMLACAVNAIQQLSRKNDALEARLSSLGV